MIRSLCLLCTLLSFSACASKPPPPPPARVHTGEIIGGFKLNSSGTVARQLTPAEVEELRKRDRAKGR